MKEIKIKNKYKSLKELEFIKIKDRFMDLCNQFETYQTDLKDFLIEDSLANQDMYVNSTYLVFDKKDYRYNKKDPIKLKLLGYFTITNDNISLSGKLKETFRAKGINYRSLPAMKIGRLCVDDRFRKRNIGRLIVVECIKRACFLNNNAACRFTTIDAKRHKEKDKDSLHFYKKLNFEVLEHKDKTKDTLIKETSGQTPMYLDIYHLIKALKITTLKKK